MTTTKQFMTFFRMLVLAFATLALAACGGGDGKGGDATGFPSKSKLKVSHSSVSVSLDKDSGTYVPASVTFTMTDADGQPAGGTISLGMPHRMVSDGDGGEKSFRLVNTNPNGNQLKIDAATGEVTLTILANVAGEGTITTTFIDSVGAKGKGPSIKVTSSVTGGADTGTPDDEDDTTTPVASVTLNGLSVTVGGSVANSANPVKNGANGQAAVILLDPAGNPMPNRIVRFETNGGGALAPQSGLVQTDATGEAKITVTAGSDGETAAYLIATYSPLSGGDSIIADTVFTTLGDAPKGETTSALSITVDFNGTESISSGNPGIATITLNAGGSSQQPIANQVIEVATTAGLLKPVTGMVMTDASGVATINVLDNGVETAGVLTATHISTSGASGASAAAAFELAGDAASTTEPLPTIAVSLSTPSINSTTPATVTIQLAENGSGVSVAGQVIKVSTDAGELDPASGMVLTDGSGVATITLRDGGVQTAGTITATLSDNAAVSGKATFSMAGDGAQGPALPTLSVLLSNTAIDDSTPATVTITLDANGTTQDIANQVVQVTTTAGLLTPASGMVLTDGSGVATINLRDNGVQTAGVISATLLDNTAVTGTATFSLAGDATATTEPKAKITVVFANNAIDAATPGQATITLDGNGTTQDIANQVIQVSATSGLLDPASGMVMTDGSGVAHITLNDNGVATAGILTAQLFGDADVKGEAAYTLAGDGNTVVQPTLSVALSTNDIDAATPATVNIQLDANGTTQDIANQVIKVTTDAGELDPASGMVLTDATGAATITLRDGGIKTAGTITATLADNAAVSGKATFTMEGDGAQGHALPTLSVALDTNLVADGSPATATITLDANGTGLNVEGQIIQLTATAGKITPAVAVITDTSGEATVTIEDNGVEAVGILSATLQSNQAVTGSAAYMLAGDTVVSNEAPTLSEPVFVDASNAPIGTLAAPITANDPAFVSVVLLDASGTAIANAAVEFALSSDVGALSQASALTDPNGKATVQLNVGTVQGAGTLTASYMDPAHSSITATSQASFAVQIGGMTGPSLTTPELKNGADVVGTTAKPINDNTPATVTVTLTDGTAPMANKVITFTISGPAGVGALDPVTGTALTDGSGVASIILNSGSNQGAATLIASYNEDEATSQIDFSTKGAGVTVVQEIALGQLDSTVTPATFDNSLEAPVGLGVGSTTSIAVDIVDITSTNPEPVIFAGSPMEVTFTSACVQAGNATLSPASAISIGGHAVTTYRANNNACIEDDIQATAVVNGNSLTAATGSFDIDPSPTSTISFIEATPPTIGIKGALAAGVEETSVITFQVKDANGNPVTQGVAVDFALQTTVGGFKITSSSSATTDAAGFVMVTVTSGTVPGVGTVRASLASDSTIYGTGSVSIQQGVATQDRFVIAIKELNPPAGNLLGYTTTVTARAADRYGNWVPDGTRINFTTKLGDIEASCDTTDGTCSVTWTSQGSQPLLFDSNRAGKSCSSYSPSEWYRQGLPQVPWLMGCLVSDQLGIDRFGINVITAWALGEESFSDLNGNNVFDDGEHYVDLPEAFDDNNISGLYDTVDGAFSEDYQDIVPNGQHDGADSKYNGLSCASTASQCEIGLINVRRAATMVLSTDAIQMLVFNGDTVPTDLTFTHSSPPAWGATLLTSTNPPATTASSTMTVVVADSNGNAPAIGTTISIETEATDGAVVQPKVQGQSECVVENRLNPATCSFSVTMGDVGNKFIITASSQGNHLTQVLEVGP